MLENALHRTDAKDKVLLGAAAVALAAAVGLAARRRKR
jgi:LPXTG-motif cell wall-anchored protein